MKTQQAIQTFLYNRKALNRSPRTLEWYASMLARFAFRYSKLPMKPEPIDEFLDSIKGQPETKHGYYRSLKALYRFTCRRQRLANPMELIDSPSCPRKIMPTLELRQMMQLLNLAERAGSLRDKAMLSLYLDNGARVGEVVTLRKQDLGDTTIRVEGKIGQREIPISEETRRLLLTLVSTNGKSEYVFTNERDRPLTRHGVYWIVRGYMRKAGIPGPKLGSNRLRHSFCKGYLVNGGDVRSLQEIMGHENISTTQKYANLNLSDTIAKHHQFTPLRAAHATAQQSFLDLDKDQAIKEAEAILTRKEDEG